MRAQFRLVSISMSESIGSPGFVCAGRRRRLRLRWHRVCRADRSRKGLATGGLVGLRHYVCGSYLLRTLPLPELRPFGSIARCLGRCARSIRPCSWCKHQFASVAFDWRDPWRLLLAFGLWPVITGLRISWSHCAQVGSWRMPLPDRTK